ncbi:MAG: RNA methyltransferase [Actinobacteria bacterium]|nr:RNA methyltransferase [Actinomycetota bacterium]
MSFSPNEIIKSLQSSHVARVKALHASKGRKGSQQFIAEGPSAVLAALHSNRFPIRTLYLTESGAALLPRDLDIETIMLSEKVMAAISTVENPQGVLAICSMEDDLREDQVFSDIKLPLVYCLEVNDPGNLGTIIRTADALGSAGVILSPGSADPFSPKVVRATAGSLWQIPVLRDVELHSAISEAKSCGRRIYVTDSAGLSRLTEVSGADALWIFGNEARGIPEEFSALADQVVAIPMRGRAESLNLATAVAITLFHANS